MDVEVKQRNRRRRRAQRMQAQRDSKANEKRREVVGGGAVSADEDDDDEDEEENGKAGTKPPRPPVRRKKCTKEPLVEEDIVEGFSILQFRTYEDLELVLKISSKENIKRLAEIERPKIETKTHITHHISAHNNHALSLTQDPATSDDSGRASERLTGSSVAPRDADSSRDRLSDASSRCSSGKGYICDSEGEDDKGSDASSVIFASTPASRKREFPGALPPSLPLSNGTSSSPVPAPTPPNLPVPSPAPAQQPPLHPPAVVVGAAATTSVCKQPSAASGGVAVVVAAGTAAPGTAALPSAAGVAQQPPQQAQAEPQPAVLPPPPPPPPCTMPQADAAAPVVPHHHHPHHHHHLHHLHHHDVTATAIRTESPATATSANVAVAPTPGQYHSHHHHHPSYPPPVQPPAQPQQTVAVSAPQTPALYAPYAMHTSYTNQTATVTSAVTNHTNDPPLPPAPTRESYSNVSSLSRSSATTPQQPPPPQTNTTAAVSSSLAKTSSTSSWNGPSPRFSPAPPSSQRPTPPYGIAPPPTSSAASTSPASRLIGAPLSIRTGGSPAIQQQTTAVQPPPPPTSTTTNPNPFSAENLFQTNQTDMLRRELDNRFLASQDRGLGVTGAGPPPPTAAPYLRTEMHQHQHHHTHVHQHTTSLLPPPAASSLFPSPLSMSPMERLARRTNSSFKDIPKLGGVESPFYRQNLGMPTYPAYTTPSLMHPGLTTGPTPFVPPNHLSTFQPKSMPADPTKPKTMKTGKWNAMHVRVAWEIYHHQQKSGEAKGGGAVAAAVAAAAAAKNDLLRPPHLFSPSVHPSTRAHELAAFAPPPPPPPGPPTHHRAPPPTFDQSPHSSLFVAPPSQFAKFGATTAGGPTALSPFTRYAAASSAAGTTSPFGVSPFATLHDPWRTAMQQRVPFPGAVNALPPTLPGLAPPTAPAPWTLKPDPILVEREREREERERLRREREERERREREEKQRRLAEQQERERREKERREIERREMERERERERERLLHQQRIETAKMAPAAMLRDRSPLKNGQTGGPDMGDVRVKEEPRKEDEYSASMAAAAAAAAASRYHPAYLRHAPSSSLLDRTRMLSAHALGQYAPPPHWPPPPPPAADPFYRYDPLRYNQLLDAMRVEEERAKLYGTYGPPPPPSVGQLRKDAAGLMGLRPGSGPGPPTSTVGGGLLPPPDLHTKKDDGR